MKEKIKLLQESIFKEEKMNDEITYKGKKYPVSFDKGGWADNVIVYTPGTWSPERNDNIVEEVTEIVIKKHNLKESLFKEAKARMFQSLGRYKVVDKNGDVVATYVAKYDAEEHVKELNSKKESLHKEAYVPSNIKEFAKRKGVSSLVNKVAGWAEKAGKRIVGGTAIGKYYDTLILDMTYNGSEIYIDTEKGTVKLYNELINDYNSFKKVLDENKKESFKEDYDPNDGYTHFNNIKKSLDSLKKFSSQMNKGDLYKEFDDIESRLKITINKLDKEFSKQN